MTRHHSKPDELETPSQFLVRLAFEIRDNPEILLLEWDGPGARFVDGSPCSLMGHPEAVQWRATSLLVRDYGEHIGMAKASPSNQLVWECLTLLRKANGGTTADIHQHRLDAGETSTWFRMAAMMAG